MPISPRSVYWVKSGISMTTGGTIMSAMLSRQQQVCPRKRMRAIANAQSAAASVDTITEPTVRIARVLEPDEEVAAVERLAEVART